MSDPVVVGYLAELVSTVRFLDCAVCLSLVIFGFVFLVRLIRGDYD